MMKEVERALVWCELREVFSHGEARTWLTTPHGALGDRSPINCSYHEVMKAIDALKSGSFA